MPFSRFQPLILKSAALPGAPIADQDSAGSLSGSLEALRLLGIDVSTTGDEARYALAGDLDDALARLPFPDPGLNFRDAQQLAHGSTAAHRKLKQRLASFTNGPRGGPNKPR